MRSLKRKILPFALILLVAGCASEAGDSGETEAEQQAPAGPDPKPIVVMETNWGTIAMELDREKAPKSVANFEVHVRSGFYDGLIFHRVMKGILIQSGRLTAEYAPRSSTAAFLDNEGDNGLLNVRGAVGMARGADPNSAKSEFFINLKDNKPLDTTEEKWGYAVFGQVISGMDVVDRIGEVETRQRGTREDVPIDPPIVIDRAYLTTRAEWEAANPAAEGTAG